jgi:hypothetical protein
MSFTLLVFAHVKGGGAEAADFAYHRPLLVIRVVTFFDTRKDKRRIAFLLTVETEQTFYPVDFAFTPRAQVTVVRRMCGSAILIDLAALSAGGIAISRFDCRPALLAVICFDIPPNGEFGTTRITNTNKYTVPVSK